MAEDPEAAYFQTVEEFFVSRRGDPLFLSNADWLLARKWRRAGLPLRVVLRGIADALDSHAHSFSRTQQVKSLHYCAAEVEAAADRWRRALAAGRPQAGRGEVLPNLTAALRGASSLGPRARAVAQALAAEMEALLELPLAEQTAWLARAEKKLLRALEEEGGEGETRRLEADVDRVLAPYRERMPAKVLEQIRAESYARRRLEAHGLPRLSLFHASFAETERNDAS